MQRTERFVGCRFCFSFVEKFILELLKCFHQIKFCFLLLIMRVLDLVSSDISLYLYEAYDNLLILCNWCYKKHLEIFRINDTMWKVVTSSPYFLFLRYLGTVSLILHSREWKISHISLNKMRLQFLQIKCLFNVSCFLIVQLSISKKWVWRTKRKGYKCKIKYKP